jgi:hypothetical protein
MASKTFKKSAKVAKKAAAEGLSMTSTGQGPASELITARIRELQDWRGEKLALVRRFIHEADPAILEEWKWQNPVWSHDGIVCTGESYKQHLKLTFAKGAFLADPHHVFNAELTGNTRRAIQLRAQDKVDGPSFRELIREAVAFNQDHPPKHRRAAKPSGAAGKGERSTATTSNGASKADKPKLLSGGNPQIAKAEGDAPVQVYIAAMPGWKRDAGRRLDALIVRTVPNVRKAMKWNSPFYGIEGQGWFLSFHCFTKYVKVAFFRGTSLRPLPPGESKNKDTRYLDIHEDDQLDEELVARWIRQASEQPGWVP